MDEKARAVAAELPRLRRYAIALLGDVAEAEDLLQETVERALSRIHLWRTGTDMRAWLFTIMHNTHVNSAKKRRREGVPVAIDDLAGTLSAAPDQIDRLRLKAFAVALDALPGDQRQTLLLVALEGMSYKATAEITGVPVGTVMSRLARARRTLRRLVDGEDAPTTMRRVK